MVASLVLVAPSAEAKRAPLCADQGGRTVVQNPEWRVFKRSARGVRTYRGTKRVDIYSCRLASRKYQRIARWTDTTQDSSTVARAEIAGGFAALAGTYRSGFSDGTFIQVFNLQRKSRMRVEGPIATRMEDLRLNRSGSVVVTTQSGPTRQLDVYDATGRRTLATGGFDNVALGDAVVYWNDANGTHAAPVAGLAANEVDIFARD